MSPNSVSLAISIASASVLYVNIDKTGPKISSFAIRMPRVTLANTVGFTKFPSSSPEGMTFPADNEFRAFLDTRLDVFLNALILLYAGQWAESHILVSRIAHLDLFDGRSHQSLHFAQPVLRHDQARSRDAGLTVVQVTGCDSHRNGSGEIGVVQNDVRRLAAEFQRQALHRVQGVLRDQFSDLCRTGERDLLNVGTFRQLRPGN